MVNGLKGNISLENEEIDYEALLRAEGLGSLDEAEGFSEIRNSTANKINSLLENKNFSEEDKIKLITELEEKHQVKFEIDNENCEVILKNPIGQIIGYFRDRSYSYGKVEASKHIERHINEEYRGRGLGTALSDVWKISGFPILEEEYSNKPSNMLFLMSSGYQITGYFDDNGEKYELTDGQINELITQINDLAKKGDTSLDFTYYLELVK